MRPAAASSERPATPPWLATIVSTAAAADTPEEAGALLAPLFDDACWLDVLTEQWMARLRADPTQTSILPATRNGPMVNVTLAVAPPVRLMLSLIEGIAERPEDRAQPRTIISFSGALGLYRFLSPARIVTTLAYAPAGAMRCRSRQVLLRSGRAMTFDERRFAMRIAPQELPVLLLRARIDRAPPAQQRRYALEDRLLVGTVQNDDGFARSAMLLSVLRAVGASEAVPVMIDLLNRPDCGARWTVMRELLALDPMAGWPHLENMAASDPELRLRTVARATLERLRIQNAERAATCRA